MRPGTPSASEQVSGMGGVVIAEDGGDRPEGLYLVRSPRIGVGRDQDGVQEGTALRVGIEDFDLVGMALHEPARFRDRPDGPAYIVAVAKADHRSHPDALRCRVAGTHCRQFGRDRVEGG
jgi:hypothetical protein